VILAGFAVWAAGCGADLNTTESVRRAIIQHLEARKSLDLDMSSMDVEVSSVTFRGNEADATVAFKARGSQTSLMQMRYTLERKSNQWQVKSKASAPGGTEANPHGLPPVQEPGGKLPPGHPPIEPEGKSSR
jgi:hypothetical protein